MKISKKLIAILRNFAMINQSIAFTEINALKISSPEGNIIGIYELPEEDNFPNCAIWDLNEFLSVLSMFNLERTEFVFEDKSMIIIEGKNKIRYYYTDLELIKGIHRLKKVEDYKKFNKFDASFILKDEDIKKIKKASNIMNLELLKIKITTYGSSISLCSELGNNKNSLDIILDETEGEAEINFDIQNIELVEGDYNINILNNRMGKFSNKNLDLFYIIGGKL